MTLPLAYISLAKGDSRTFMVQELIYDVVFVLAVLLFFKYGGVTMIGAALTVAAVLDLCVVSLITHVRYNIRLSAQSVRVFLIQLPVIVASFAAVSYVPGIWKWVTGLILLGLSSLISFRYLRKHTSFIRSVSGKIGKKMGL